jgi:hypothetical protein
MINYATTLTKALGIARVRQATIKNARRSEQQR